MPNPLCLLLVLAGKRLAEEGIPTILWAPKPSLWSQSSSHLYTHTCLHRPRFQGTPWGPHPGLPPCQLSGLLPFPGLEARQQGSGSLLPAVSSSWACGLGVSTFPCSPPCSCFVPTGRKAGGSLFKCLLIPISSCSLPAYASPTPPQGVISSEVAGLGSLYPLLVDLSHHTDEPSLNVTWILFLPCSQAFRGSPFPPAAAGHLSLPEKAFISLGKPTFSMTAFFSSLPTLRPAWNCSPLLTVSLKTPISVLPPPPCQNSPAHSPISPYSEVFEARTGTHPNSHFPCCLLIDHLVLVFPSAFSIVGYK